MLRNSTEVSLPDLEFVAEEDLCQQSTMQILMLKGAKKEMKLTKKRMFQSYINEFCGISGLASNTLKFQIFKKDVNPLQEVKQAVTIKVSHNEKFFNAPNNSLRPDFKSILDEQICTDLTLVAKDAQGVAKKVQVNRCILAARSTHFAHLIENKGGENCTFINLKGVSFEMLQHVLIWIYTGNIKIPDDITEIIGILETAENFQLGDLVWRCEEEVLAKISPRNVVDVLVKYFQAEQRVIRIEDVEETKRTHGAASPSLIRNSSLLTAPNFRGQRSGSNRVRFADEIEPERDITTLSTRTLPTRFGSVQEREDLAFDDHRSVKETIKNPLRLEGEEPEDELKAESDVEEEEEKDNVSTKAFQNHELSDFFEPKKRYQLSITIINRCKTIFIKEFNEVLYLNPDMESKLAQVPGLIISLFSHVSEVQRRKKRNKVRFALHEEIRTNSLVGGSRFDQSMDTHSEGSSRM